MVLLIYLNVCVKHWIIHIHRAVSFDEKLKLILNSRLINPCSIITFTTTSQLFHLDKVHLIKHV